MRIFKFGGASVKDAQSVQNVANILQKEGTKNTLVVVSAMGKMTNAFEKVVNAFYNNSNDLKKHINDIEQFHYAIVDQLFPKQHKIYEELTFLFGKLSAFFIQNSSDNYNYVYDQIVSFGELLSTKIVSAYLQLQDVENTWLDVRDYIKTDTTYRDAAVDWQLTQSIITAKIDQEKLYVTQGFLGGCEGTTTTLGREGSDYTAAIFAYCLNAESVTIWKDVEGVLNGDPRVFEKTKLLEQISYKEAIEMAFYGASVIHPKTLKPLENKLIPLHVRSFVNTNAKGTVVSKGEDIVPKMPCFILKKEQKLVSISAKDFSFMVEHNLSHIFQLLSEYRLKVNLIQNSAISFSVCVEDKFNRFQDFLSVLQQDYNVQYNDNVKLFTIRHFDKNAVERIEKSGKILLKQESRETIQIIVQ